ncbi:MAG TPA: hypothetical protein VH560_14345 [Polyangia bacterium]|nr:hypothetical protein [Polyangia bacterium]
MSPRVRVLFGVATFIGLMAAASSARAQCCPGYTLATACAGQTLTKTRWCIQNTAPTGQASLPAAFCPYGDKVISTLEEVFNIQAPSIFEFELDTKTGGAHTGTACQALGDGVAYDAFSGSAYGATYFWGYLLAMHEAINDWTGMASGGWPTDWWADHQSAFPNLMDFHIMNTIGVANNDQNLIKAAAAQKKRFYPGGDSADAKVVALDNVYALMPGGDGFKGFSHMFAMQKGDGVSWDGLGVPNPDVKRSEYVAAYMSLAAGQSVLKTLQGPSLNGGGKICNGTPDGTATDAPYTCSDADVNAIATAHCAANANGKQAADMKSLRGGNYASVPSGPCGATCPSECGCDTQNHCVAAWVANPAISGTAGASGEDAGASGGAGAGTTDAGGSLGGGVAGASGGASSAEAGASGGGAGATTSGAAGAATGAAGAAGAPSADATAGTTACACTFGDGGGTMPRWLGCSGLALAALGFRRRARR